jgi:Ca-activated chloride channel family protein
MLTTLAVFLSAAVDGVQSGGSFRVDSTLVLVPVSVVDTHDRPVTGLQPRQFRVFEDGKEQPIASFERADTPVSIGVVFDNSGSMDGKAARAREVLARVCENLNPEDEMFVITVQGAARLTGDFTRDCGELQNGLLLEKPNGFTALLDALPLAFRHLRAAHHRRRAVLLISDGGENASRMRSRELRSLAVEAGVPIYVAALTTGARAPNTMEETRGPELLRELIEYSGGRYWEIDDWRRPGEAGRQIAAEIHDQYVIGYRAPATAADGKYRRIQVRVMREQGTPRLSVSFRGGYYPGVE